MPIIFPKGILEKVIEKVVEKTVYVAVSLSRQFDMFFTITKNIVKPTPEIVSRFALGITRFIYALRLPIARLVFYIIKNPIIPTGRNVASILLSLRKDSRKAQKLPLTYSITTTPSKPIPQTTLTMPIPLALSSTSKAQKLPLTYSITTAPSKPIPQTLITFATSVTRRKTP